MSMKHRDTDRQDRLTRLLASAGPGSVPTLEPDPHLPARIRAMVREGAAGRAGGGAAALLRPRWAWLSFGTVAVALAVVAGAYIGYRAGTSLAASSAREVSEAEIARLESADAFWNAWSQSGFAEDLREWDVEDGEVN
jgi:hypothetical protein